MIHEGHPEYVPFPKWNPANPIPSYFDGFEPDNVTPYDNIASNCLGGLTNGCKSRENYQDVGAGNFRFNQSGEFNNNIPLPGRYDQGTICNFPDITYNLNGGGTVTFDWDNITDFSDESQQVYHNAGHRSFDRVQNTTGANRSLMGTLAPNRAAAAFIFWAWHAHIDDLWWNWDICKKQTGNTSPTGLYNFANGFTVSSGTTTTWDNNGQIIKIQGNLVIGEFYKLNL